MEGFLIFLALVQVVFLIILFVRVNSLAKKTDELHKKSMWGGFAHTPPFYQEPGFSAPQPQKAPVAPESFEPSPYASPPASSIYPPPLGVPLQPARPESPAYPAPLGSPLHPA
ncbi:MAG: hypothetical protein FWD43_01305, partial [Coriobacteriia bacterium]|nr:hypothetical protein [Coriobacteriia bacterium]